MPSSASGSPSCGKTSRRRKERKTKRRRGEGCKKGESTLLHFSKTKNVRKQMYVVQRRRLHPVRLRCLLSRLACPAVLQPRPEPFLLLGSSQRPQPRRDGGSARAPRGSTWPLTAPPARCPQRAPQTSHRKPRSSAQKPKEQTPLCPLLNT